MPETLCGVDRDRLERSCDSIRFGSSAPGLELAEVRLAATRFEPHRHDTYAVGVTTAGVQAFRYRGERRICLPGQLHVLYPDELHDGGPATDAGFAYRILYVAPELVSGALGGRPLPFVADPVQPAPPELASLLCDVDEPIDELRRAAIAATVADALLALADRPAGGAARVDLSAVERVRDHIAAHAREATPAATLERIAGLDRFTLARHFRRAYGTSPDRYRTLRRLALARAAIERGQPLARAAAEAGFADQSHMTRQFKRAYGLTPARWARTVRRAPEPRARPR
jgi:AraC-like DNA-binding protein